ncbi:histidine kinase [Actinoplanes sp. NPDC051633]|uniref:sensor histidine kinase n=1 Tax=Actinoplanes sp. NPDC051633 TaxID=3155670 RepID=UPI003415B403
MQLAEAAGVARQATDQVRATVVDDDHDHAAANTRPTGETVAPRVARLVLLVILGAFLAQLLLNVSASGLSGPAKVGASAVIVTVLVMQLYHSLARRNAARPPGWPWTLAGQVLGVASFWVFDELTLLALAGFAAGSVLLLFPGRWAWAALAATAGGVGLVMAVRSGYGIFDGVYVGASVAATGLAVYALSRLTDVADQLAVARRDLARTAVVQERLRLARDIHDLLGLGLSAVALKCDLAAKLIGRDDNRSRSEIVQLLDIAANALTDLKSVTGNVQQPLSLGNELTAARDTLASAGIDVRADVAMAPVGPAVDEVLATVLREAVTNVLRHATATWCTIRLVRTDDVVRLHVGNDGAGGRGTSGTGGTGISNLRARTTELGGTLVAGPDGADCFELAVEFPVAHHP